MQTVEDNRYQSSATIKVTKQNRYKPLKHLPKRWVLDPLQFVDVVTFHRFLKQPLDFAIFMGITAELYQLKLFLIPKIR